MKNLFFFLASFLLVCRLGAEEKKLEMVEPGDVLEITVTEDAAFNGNYQVRKGGYIIVPKIGRMGVADKTLEQAADTLSKRLIASSEFKAKTATVRIKKTKRQKIRFCTDETRPKSRVGLNALAALPLNRNS